MSHTMKYGRGSVSHTKSSNKSTHNESTTALTTQTDDLFPHNSNMPSSTVTDAAHMPVDLLHIAAWTLDERQHPILSSHSSTSALHDFGGTHTRPGAALVHVGAWIVNEPYQHSFLPPYACTTTAHNSGVNHCLNIAEVDDFTSYEAVVHDNLAQQPEIASTEFHGPAAWRDQTPEQPSAYCSSSNLNQQYLASAQSFDGIGQFQSLTTYNLTRHTLNIKSEAPIQMPSTAETEISSPMTYRSREVVGQ